MTIGIPEGNAPPPPPEAKTWRSGRDVLFQIERGDHSVRWRYRSGDLLHFVVYEREAVGWRSLPRGAARDVVIRGMGFAA